MGTSSISSVQRTSQKKQSQNKRMNHLGRAANCLTLVLLVTLTVACGTESDDADDEAPTAPVESAPMPTPAAGSDDWWKPGIETTWQWQLGEPPIDRSFDVDVYDIDLFDNEASTVDALHAQGRKVICYVSVGSWEDWRPDKDQFPDSVIGK